MMEIKANITFDEWFSILMHLAMLPNESLLRLYQHIRKELNISLDYNILEYFKICPLNEKWKIYNLTVEWVNDGN